jgi:hypothetical protein
MYILIPSYYLFSRSIKISRVRINLQYDVLYHSFGHTHLSKDKIKMRQALVIKMASEYNI